MNTRYKGIGLLIIVAFFMQSCKDYLDYQSPSKLNLEQTFEDADYTNGEILGIYNRAAGRDCYGGNLAMLFPLGADDFTIEASSNFSPANNYAIPNFGASKYNNALYNTFFRLYQGIERANIACKYIPLSNIYKQGSADQRKRMRIYYGEALALRALFYSELIRNWGDVPSTFIPSADIANQFIPNANRDETYARILEDLKMAAEFVGWRSELPAYGAFRLTKGAIKALRARIALAAGGYSLRSESHLMERRSDYLDFYKIAFDECMDIIKSQEHRLNPVYENIFKSLHGTVRYDDTNEILFEVAMWGGINDSDLARSNGMGFSNTTWGNGGGGERAVIPYFYEFEKDVDIRKDVTLAIYSVKDNNLKKVEGAKNLMNAKFRKSWTEFDASAANLTFGVNWPIIRYADVLLMYAEAGNELQNVSGEITPLRALQMVRERAYGSNPISLSPAYGTAFFEAIVKERLLEFGGEGIRKYDLVRWNLLATKIAEVKQKVKWMAAGAPTEGNPYNFVPEYIYAKPTLFTNRDSKTENRDIDVYGGDPSVAYYTKTTVVPAGYTRNYWGREAGQYNNGVLTSSYLDDRDKAYASRFEPNKKELLPYPDKILIENRGAVKQNYGYE